jgi:hypothetical protein
VEQLGAGSGTEGVQALSESALYLSRPRVSVSAPKAPNKVVHDRPCLLRRGDPEDEFLVRGPQRQVEERAAGSLLSHDRLQFSSRVLAEYRKCRTVCRGRSSTLISDDPPTFEIAASRSRYSAAESEHAIGGKAIESPYRRNGSEVPLRVRQETAGSPCGAGSRTHLRASRF